MLYSEQRLLDVVTTRLSKKGLINVEDKIHILNICDYETPTVQFAEAEERTVGLEVMAHCLPRQAAVVGLLWTLSFAKEDV